MNTAARHCTHERRRPLPRPPARHAIRPAVADDAAAIARIYNEGILDRTATLETETRSAGGTPRSGSPARASDIRSLSPRRRCGRRVGSLNVFNPRRCYDHVAEFSIYVAREWRGRGRRAHAARRGLSRRRASIGFHKLVLATFPFNGRASRSTRAPGSARRRLPRAGPARWQMGRHRGHGKASLSAASPPSCSGRPRAGGRASACTGDRLIDIAGGGRGHSPPFDRNRLLLPPACRATPG